MRMKRRNKERVKETQRKERSNARGNPLKLEREEKTARLWCQTTWSTSLEPEIVEEKSNAR
jgi:hypothetical protein